MEKKKAIKLVTATAIAASSFGVTASIDAASNSVDKSVKKATDQMRKAYNTYMQAAKSGKLVSYSTVKKEIDLAKTYYYAAIKAADKAGAKRGNYRKQLFENKKLLSYAERYALTIKINLKTPQADLDRALASGDVDEVTAARTALNSKVYSFNKSTAQVYGAEARKLFNNQAKPAKAKLLSANEDLAVYNANEEIERSIGRSDHTKAALQIAKLEAKVDKLRSKNSTFAKNIVDRYDGFSKRSKGALTIEGDDQGNRLTNGTAKVYTVTLKHPGTGKPIQGAKLNVTFEENLETDFKPQRNVWITDDDNDMVVPYQSTDGKEEQAVVRTDKNGKATFTVTGTNGTVTPIVFLDGSNQEWDTNGGKLPEPQDGRFDEGVEIAASTNSVTFAGTAYKIEVEGKRTNHAAIVDDDRSQINGREYKITVKKPNGDPWVGGMINVGIDELLDGKLGNDPRGAFLVEDDDVFDEDERYEQLRLKLDGKGQAEFFLASTKVNDSARPVVWIDQNDAPGYYDGRLEDGEPVSDRDEVDPTNFQPPYIDPGTLGAKLEVRDGTDADFRYWEDHFREIPDDLEDVKGFKLNLLNQSGNPFLPDSYNDDAKDARVTFEVVNTGPNPVKVHTAGFLENSSLKNPVTADDSDISDGVVRIGVGGRVTIAGDIIELRAVRAAVTSSTSPLAKARSKSA